MLAAGLGNTSSPKGKQTEPSRRVQPGPSLRGCSGAPGTRGGTGRDREGRDPPQHSRGSTRLGIIFRDVCSISPELAQNTGRHLSWEGFCRRSELPVCSGGTTAHQGLSQALPNPEVIPGCFWSLCLWSGCSSTAEARPARAAPGSCQSTSALYKGEALCCIRAASSWAELCHFKGQLCPAHTAVTPMNFHWITRTSCNDQLNLSKAQS